MPRVTPLPTIETAIGQRLAQVRKEKMIHRTALALKIGISTDRLVSYELGRVKLPWGIGNRACEILEISQHWLAHGGSAYLAYVKITSQELSDADIERLPFSEVYEKHFLPWLKPKSDDVLRDISRMFSDLEAAIEVAAVTDVRISQDQLNKLFEALDLVRQRLAWMLRGPKK
jgi:DNA-binding XRE family transcriptional regulator